MSSCAHPNTSQQSSSLHPLDPLTREEIQRAVAAVRAAITDAKFIDNKHRLWFKSVQLQDPAKKVLVPLLEEWNSDVAQGIRPKMPTRVAEVLVGIKTEKAATWYEYFVGLPPQGAGRIVKSYQAPQGLHTPLDFDELEAAEVALRAHPDFQRAIEQMQLPSNAKVVADAWIYGADSTDASPRYISFMVYLSFKDHPDSNHYAAPLPLVPTLLADTFEMVRIDYTPIRGTGNTTILDLDGPFPCDHYISNEYDQEILSSEGHSFRQDLQPLNVVQPQGASFKVIGRTIQWQKWQLHVGFNYREGVVLNDVRYDGRRLFHRLSVSDMTVPYGDPRSPLHRKQAFDLGDVGAGICANELKLGCDCLGEIYYMDFEHVDSNGKAVSREGVVCIHEQDDGIGWKHTNYRTNNPTVKRSRILVIQMMITVANYEYIFAWKLDQAAALHLETRATGILSTAAILPGEKSPYGNIVSPGVLATNHQHLFSVRIDPAIDGDNNTVVQEDSEPMPFDKHNPDPENRYGVGYVVKKTPITTSGFADAAPEKNRVFKIINPNKVNPISGNNVGYKLVPTPSQLMLAHKDSVAYARAEFGQHHIYVTSHQEDELYAGGKYTNQSSGNAKGINTWIARKDNVQNADLVLWHTFGLTHNPRVEDFPVMPCETHQISLKPADFFSRNPATDVPNSNQGFNKSKLHQGSQGDSTCCKNEPAHLLGCALL